MSKAIQVYVDSTYRLSGDTTNFKYNLKQPIKAKYFKLTSAEIPLTYYNVRNVSGAVDNNHIFYFSENNGTTTLQAPLATGYYTSTTIATALKTALDTATANAYVYTVSYTALTQKFTITSTGNFKVMYPSWLSVNWMLGFNQASSNGTSNTANTLPYLDYYQYLYLRLSGLNAEMCYDETGSNNNIMKIPITAVQSSIQFYFDVSDNHFVLNSERPVQSFDVQLLDSDYYPINLNGREYSFTLTFYYD